jgi:glutathione S-transferase
VRLEQLSTALGSREWLTQEFSAADVLMIHVLRRLERTEHLKAFPNVSAYIERAAKRPAYQRAFQAQLEVYRAAHPEG